MGTAGIRLEASTTGNAIKENVLSGHSIDVQDLGTGNIVTENVYEHALK